MARKKQPRAVSVKSVQAAAGATSGGKKAAKSIPIGVKVIAVLSWIAAIFFILLALLLFAGAGFAESILQLARLEPGGEKLSGISAGALGGIFAFIGFLFLDFGILYIFIGRGLWKGQNWARIISIVLAILGIVWSLSSIAAAPGSSLFWIIVYGVIGGYLWFNKDVKKAFAS